MAKPSPPQAAKCVRTILRIVHQISIGQTLNIYMKHIDPHVHCRDGNEAQKTNIGEVSKIATNLGIVAIFDMPNTEPPILTEKDVRARLRLAEKREPTRCGGYPKYFLYVGLTPNENQIKKAAKLVENYPQVIGLKLYAAKSGKLGVSRETDQKKIYRILADLNYLGILAVHAEKEKYFKPWLWNPEKPWTHNLTRPEISEIEGVRDQIQFARISHLKGNLHICHITLPESVDLVLGAKKDLRITCGVTPHHILFTENIMRKKNGILFKVNPPLRGISKVTKLREYLRQGKIDWIESDHAPHTLEEKLSPPYLSGIASLHLYPRILNWLNSQKMSRSEIKSLTYWNIKKVFKEKLKDL
ncbi:MAG: dihydroorotase [Candidatus Nealsonbacteria bacterium CG_4_9_14_0_2_um_filter_37_38]|uniref:Dihydroorotase n=1 Tax=Candidatus Nealsonbacteria bacterium CG_4_10_14_0_8_um_filter_37_14 TaxID=1974684 RepID=A0A2M7R6H0_9BACT|nr:MAG: dihydroorotase [Candidatus Nealsonbacteria bacterium CG11_big_fil_rev_8_21_14_0_20_37_68]PIY88714.1 MAG: dihydroorotase [Candidatus Nealsonbacteria bacterium CG_4_10_14_0_8_um_filter_37_14]PJC51544.1 MAG: dihydroorotase [Candidatus Nealsonbacteria bacterium CG_4_9_14_0_2_um_filter_37_38]